MTKLLFIKASPRGADSRSAAVAEAYLTRLKAGDPELIVDVVDLWHENLPVFDGNKANAKLAVITKQSRRPRPAAPAHRRSRRATARGSGDRAAG